MNIGTIKTDYKEREIASESKLQTIPDGDTGHAYDLQHVQGLPPRSLFFSLISCFLTIVGIVFFIPIFHTYFLTRTGI